MSLFRKSTSVIAIDIGSSSVKMVQLEALPNSRQYRLVAWGKEDLSAETIVDGEIMNTSAVVDAIKNLTANSKVKDVAASISGSALIVKRITMPATTRDALDEQAKYEAEQYIPFDVESCNIDAHMLEGSNPDPSQMDVLLVAARQDLVSQNSSLLQQAGLNPVVMDVDSFALANMFTLNYPQYNEDGVVALVNIGSNSVNVHILRCGISVFTRDLNSGGFAFTEEIQRALTVSFEEAERLKIGDDENPMTMDVQNVLRNATDALVNEIRNTLDFYLSTSADGIIDRIMITGGASRTPTLVQSLENQLGLMVEEIDPFREIQVDEREFKPDFLDEIGPQLSIAVGLATRRPTLDETGCIDINLIPKKYNRRQQAIFDELGDVAVVLVGILLVCFGLHWYVWNEVENMRTQDRGLQVQIDANKVKIEEVKVLQSTQELLMQKLDAIRDLQLKKIGPVRMMDELAIHCPEKLQLTKLRETNGLLELEGIAATSPDASKFTDNLQRSEFFVKEETRLNTIEQVEVDGVKLKSFKIRAKFVVPNEQEQNDKSTEKKR